MYGFEYFKTVVQVLMLRVLANPLSDQGATSDSSEYPMESNEHVLTRDVYAKPLHSHNDYWRQNPFMDALRAGCVSVESDVFHFTERVSIDRNLSDDTMNQSLISLEPFKLYVGHSEVFLSPSNTLNNLYLDPLMSMLDYANPTVTIDLVPTQKNGVFYNEPETPLYFWLDFKSNATESYFTVMESLRDLISKGYLAYYDTRTNEYIPGPVIVTITGNLPVEQVMLETIRYVFLDGDLTMFDQRSTPTELDKISELSRVASASILLLLREFEYETSLRAPFSKSQIDKITEHIRTAHNYGLKTRIWGDVTWPNLLIKNHLRSLFVANSDLLNVDQLDRVGELIEYL